MAQPPADTVSPAHALDFPFDRRWLLAVWRWLYFEEGPRDDAGLDPVLARGRYVVDALAHCGACHTPRTALGGRDLALYLAGNADGPEGETVPNITPDEARGIGRWSRQDLVFLLTASMLPDGDTVSAPWRRWSASPRAGSARTTSTPCSRGSRPSRPSTATPARPDADAGPGVVVLNIRLISGGICSMGRVPPERRRLAERGGGGPAPRSAGRHGSGAGTA